MDKEIADELKLSSQTVGNTKCAIFQRLRVNTSAEAIIRAWQDPTLLTTGECVGYFHRPECRCSYCSVVLGERTA